ncbi:protein FAR1-RELATED SEQUENCE 5, partial [Trifolium medium]|nr:protein FAR1-RELATED SEQUENCE 5 [Trifolium medium]
DGHTSDDEDSSYSVSSGYDSLGDGDDTSNDHDDDDAGNDHDFDDDTFVGDRAVRINSMTSDEIRAMEFDSIDEAYEFYYQYGKCKGFSVRKSDDKKKNFPD